MTLQQTSDRGQDQGHPGLPRETASPDPRPTASPARFYRPRLLSGSSAAWAAAAQPKTVLGLCR